MKPEEDRRHPAESVMEVFPTSESGSIRVRNEVIR